MPTTVIKTCEDAGCNNCGDKIAIKLLPEFADLAVDPSGFILATLIDFEKRSTGTKTVKRQVYDPNCEAAKFVTVYEPTYEYVYTLSYLDAETVAPDTLINCSQVSKICCLGCGVDYILNKIAALEV